MTDSVRISRSTQRFSAKTIQAVTRERQQQRKRARLGSSLLATPDSLSREPGTPSAANRERIAAS